MSLVTMTIPGTLAEQIGWLERMLVGPDLAQLVAELTALHSRGSSTPQLLTRVLGPGQPEFLLRGLGGLTAAQMRALLTNPSLLLDLQELILTEGGPHWHRLLQQDADLQESVARGRERLEQVLPPRPRLRPAPDQPLPRRSSWTMQAVLLCLATAAAVLVCVNLWNNLNHSPVAATGWGWDRPGALPQTASRIDYLEALAAGGEQWFNQRPNNPTALARRIHEFRQGCSTLLLTEHRPLPEADRKWLQERCRLWATKIDAALEELESGRSVDEVRQSLDGTVNQLVKALRDRAARV